MKTQRLAQTLAAFALLGLACSSDSNDTGDNGSCDGGKCDDDDEVRESPCDGKIHDRAGRGLGSGRIAGGLGDPIAKIAFAGDGCPTNFTDIVAKLKDSGSCEEHRTAMISEDSQLLGRPGSYRAVTSIDCDTDDGFSTVWFSAFGIRAASDPAQTPIPNNVEMMAFDPVEGVFNYYETEDSGVAFFGDSKQFITEGTGSNGDARCAGCHTGGGLIMKELASPWLHWTGDFDSPGHSEIIGANESLMGFESDGIELENQVIAGNDEWNDKRVEFLRSGAGSANTVADVLRPIFCTVEVNLDSNFSSGTTSGSLFGAVVDSNLSGFESISWEDGDYEAMIEANGQRMRVGNETDTLGSMAHPSRGAADVDYVQKLVSAGIVDSEFVSDVRLIDFTRSIFSEERC